MADMQRPLSPHLQIYKWQVQMVTSIVHRATGVALSVGTLLLVWGLVALASGASAFDQYKQCLSNPLGLLLTFGWSWALFFHLCNGIRHLLQDAGLGYDNGAYVRSSWLSIIVSVVLAVLVWAYILLAHGASA